MAEICIINSCVFVIFRFIFLADLNFIVVIWRGHLPVFFIITSYEVLFGFRYQTSYEFILTGL